MKCEYCGREYDLDVFSTTDDTFVVDVECLLGICFNCFDKVPEYIPKTQVKKWLYHYEMQNL